MTLGINFKNKSIVPLFELKFGLVSKFRYTYLIQSFILVATSVVLSSKVHSQVEIQTVRKGVIFKKEYAAEFGMHTNGYLLSYTQSRIRNYYSTNGMFATFSYVRDPRESKNESQVGSNHGEFRNYTYGKQNSFFALRTGLFGLRYFSEKARDRGVAVALVWRYGMSAGILKPYYLKILDNHDGENLQVLVRYEEDNKDEFLDPDHILGKGSFFKGITELSIIPGAYGQLGLRIDPGAYEKYVRSLEIGIQSDLYIKKVPILVTEKNKSFFLNFYLSLQLGKRR